MIAAWDICPCVLHLLSCFIQLNLVLLPLVGDNLLCYVSLLGITAESSENVNLIRTCTSTYRGPLICTTVS